MPKAAILSVARDIVFSLATRGDVGFEGPAWEKCFADAIGADWKPSNVGLDDVVLGNCCWGAKTVKSEKPFTQSTVRLISGRNSPDYSFDVDGVRALGPDKVGQMVLAIWNERVSAVRKRFKHVRTVVLLKGPGLLSCSIFEHETVRFEPERVRWRWNRKNNLEGEIAGTHRFTWQPHGSQFTVIESVPTNRACFTVKAPPTLPADVKEVVLRLLGFDETWVGLR